MNKALRNSKHLPTIRKSTVQNTKGDSKPPLTPRPTSTKIKKIPNLKLDKIKNKVLD